MADNEAKWMRILEVHFSSEDSEDLQLGLTLTHCSVMLTHTQLSLLRLERKASPASQPASQPASTNLNYYRFISSTFSLT